ncbi:AbrB/MazE/SpoVT family DNA-binding domain-containing protein [Paenibacillus validus]|nr:AbrB/MazE/SpoVT family DNA-binding domain-containing protein [Paenibacillus validus]
MEISRISSKGQVTIPKSIRELLEVDAGDRILFIEEWTSLYNQSQLGCAQ